MSQNRKGPLLGGARGLSSTLSQGFWTTHAMKGSHETDPHSLGHLNLLTKGVISLQTGYHFLYKQVGIQDPRPKKKKKKREVVSPCSFKTALTWVPQTKTHWIGRGVAPRERRAEGRLGVLARLLKQMALCQKAPSKVGGFLDNTRVPSKRLSLSLSHTYAYICVYLFYFIL